MVATACPSRDTLFQYSLGLLTGEARDALDGHLDSCPDCQAAMMTLDDADDTLIGRLRAPLSSESVLAEPELEDALAAAMAMPERPVGTPDGVAVELPRQHAEDGSGLAGPLTSDMPEMLGEYRVLEELGRGPRDIRQRGTGLAGRLRPGAVARRPAATTFLRCRTARSDPSANE